MILRARPERGQVGARIGLRVKLAPQLLGGEDLPQVALLLRLGAVDDDGGSDDAQPEAVGRRRRIGARHLVGHDGLLHRPRPAAAIRPGPAHPEVAGVVELAMPDAALGERPDGLAREVVLEPGADLLAEGDVLGSVVEIHGGLSSIQPALGVTRVGSNTGGQTGQPRRDPTVAEENGGIRSQEIGRPLRWPLSRPTSIKLELDRLHTRDGVIRKANRA